MMVRNLGELFFEKSAKHPQKTALIFPELKDGSFEEKILSFSQMESLARRFQTRLKSMGIQKADRILMLAPLSPEFYAFVIGASALGAVPVFVDSSLGLKGIFSCVRSQKPAALVCGPRIRRWSFLLPQLWRSQKIELSDPTFSKPDACAENLSCTPLEAEDPSIITFTTGSTGAPKGADRNLGILWHQYRLSRSHWPESEDEVDMPCFPNIVTLNLMCGITTVLPAMDLRHPARVNPDWVLQQIRRHGVTRMSGSPAYLSQIFRHVLARGEPLSQIRSLVAGGAPVSEKLCEWAEKALPNSANYVVYGSTEVEPIAFAPMKEVLASQAPGFLVGHPLAELQLKVVSDLSGRSDEFAGSGPDRYTTKEIGEVIVSGPHVVRRYFDNEAANRETKLRDPHGKIWHRTGDLGYLDDLGRLILVGRIQDQVQCDSLCLANYPIEKSLEKIPGVERAAILSAKNQIWTFVQRAPQADLQTLSPAIEKVLKDHQLFKTKISWIKEMPVDHRHNSKIDRKKLREEHL